MLLSLEEVERISFYTGLPPEEFVVVDDGFYRLKNKNGKCIFLSRNNECKIYPVRPLGCMFYPIVVVIPDYTCTVDRYCPAWRTVTKREMKKACPILVDHVKRIFAERGRYIQKKHTNRK